VTTTGSRRTRWRERWAKQETARRSTAYQTSLARWRRREAELRSSLATATTTRPAREGDTGWHHLAHGEAVYWTASDAGLIETAHVSRLHPPHYRELGRADEPAAGPPVDTGQVAITDRRVVYIGRMVREWPYSKLIGMSHTVAGETWLLVTNGQKVAGVALPPAAVAGFRLHLALALADNAGQRDDFAADLAAQIERHEEAKPQPPAPATAGEAPRPAGPGRRGWLLAAAAASAVLVSLVAIGAALGGDRQRPDSYSAATESPAVPSPPPESLPPTESPSTESPPAPRAEPQRLAVPPRQQPPPPPTTSPPEPTPSPSPTEDPLDPRFSDCDEANENGFGPYFRDEDPEYWWYPDRNGDGVVCRP
jgi:Excalibur calcium-binding domain